MIAVERLRIARHRPGVGNPQHAHAFTEVTGPRQFCGAATQRPHQPSVRIDSEETTGRKCGHHNADEQATEEKFVANRSSLGHIRPPCRRTNSLPLRQANR